MQFIIFSLILILISLGGTSAQSFIGKINPFSPDKPLRLSEHDTLKILAVMVNFQEDRDESTFGNGKFGSIYSKEYGNTILDPLPHDKVYFDTHLEFVKNYFNKTSKGNLNIDYTVLPDTFSVSKTMRNYSPSINSDDFTLLGEFSKEAWTIAGTKYPGFNFSDYDVFIIFHAGVGRDISLPGSIGNERDLPSVYLGDNTLKKIFNNDLTGLPLNREGKYNSMIIPETESRELASLTGTVLFEITINGLLVASIASHLGLPDLFDTNTGLSAIGRFGLMDGQSIFAYNGLFPPEPSAWEKIFLGWAEPVTISPQDYNITLANHLNAAAGDTVILKVPINSSEYFLIENRLRDAGNDGARLTYILNGVPSTKVFLKDTSGFFSYSVDSVDGVVTDVDEFDWALPGSGVVIWHIYENIINEKIAENKINTDKDNRGIDVEEADGVQDIGERFFNIFGDEVIAEGSFEDFWFAGNKAPLFRNRFSKDTRPNTNSNSGANSLITISDFSEISNRMSFKISFGDSVIIPVFTAQLNTALKINSLSHSSDLNFDIIIDSSLMLVSQSDVVGITGTFSSFKTASFEINGIRYILGASGNKMNIFDYGNKQFMSLVLSGNETITAMPVVRRNLQNEQEIIIGTSSGRVLLFSADDPSFTGKEPVQLTDEPILKIAAAPDYIAAFTKDQVFQDADDKNNYDNVTDIILSEKGSLPVKIILYDQNKIQIDSPGFTSDFSLDHSATVNSIALADLKNDGGNYILYANGNNLEAVNFQGAVAENFPFADPLGIGFTGTPLAADFEGDGKAEVIAYTKDGRIFAIDGGTGNVVNGFPISAGAELAAVPVLFYYQGRTSLAAVDVQNNFYVWNIGADEGKFFWSEESGNKMNTSFVSAAENTNFTNEFFPANKFYNYPNPVYGSETAIRYYVSESSNINIKIFDLAGDFVAELNDYASGGFDKETVWNVNGIQSGVYLAKLEATSPGGKTESNIIKIAVVK